MRTFISCAVSAQPLSGAAGNRTTFLLKKALTGAAVAWMLGLAPLSPAQASGIPVFDAAALGENMLQRLVFLEQWARDNIAQSDQLQSINTGNVTLDETQQLMEQNYAMINKATWSNIADLQERSLTLIQAARAAWAEFGSAQQYYASFQTAQAWEQCFNSGNCNFGRIVPQLENSSIAQARQAYQYAEQVNQKLSSQVARLQNIIRESENSDSQAGTIDALAKINGTVASSLVDLNSQISLMTKLQSHQLASESNRRLGGEAYFKSITTYTPRPDDNLPQYLPGGSSYVGLIAP